MDRIVSQFMAEMDGVNSVREADDTDAFIDNTLASLLKTNSNNNNFDNILDSNEFFSNYQSKIVNNDTSTNNNNVNTDVNAYLNTYEGLSYLKISSNNQLSKSQDIIVIASTNRPDLVDTSLLRPGRFDKLIYVGIPANKEEKLKVLLSQTLKVKVDKEVLNRVSEVIPNVFSGADIASLCSSAYSIALKDLMSKNNIDLKSLTNNKINKSEVFVKSNEKNSSCGRDFLSDVVLEYSHFEIALEKITPSLSEQELIKYSDLKAKFESFK